jgi:hypothetical protein
MLSKHQPGMSANKEKNQLEIDKLPFFLCIFPSGVKKNVRKTTLGKGAGYVCYAMKQEGKET